MRKILGLDLGVGSIGWSLIEMDLNLENEPKLIALGERIIPFNGKESDNFIQGRGESVCKVRTSYRSMRKGLDRTQQMKKSLRALLNRSGLSFSKELYDLPPYRLWELRAEAALGKEIGLDKLGRVIEHLSTHRGYRHSKGADDVADTGKRKSDYLAEIAQRDAEARDKGFTPGQYFFQALKDSLYTTKKGKSAVNFSIKNKVFPRHAYENELHTILSAQQKNYPEVLTDEVCRKIFDMIFYQRPLKSCKHLVSRCEFEAFEIETPEGKKKKVGPKVCPASSPLAQFCRIWEVVNNIKLTNYNNKNNGNNSADRLSRAEIIPDIRERELLADYLNTHDKLSTSELLKILKLKKTDGFSTDKNVSTGIKGNSTYCRIRKALGDMPGADELVRFEIKLDSEMPVRATGEMVQAVSDDYLRQPLYMLWHTLYTISDKDEMTKALANKFGITDSAVVERLYNIDFRGEGYSNKSAKFMRKLIPQLMKGLKYSEACEAIGVKHSDSMTTEERDARVVASSLSLLKKGELRQPVVEKILNQMIHQVNAIVEAYGQVDEIRVELARELKQNREKREKDFMRMKMREKDAKEIEARFADEFNLRPTRNETQKYRLWREAEYGCIYCGKPISQSDFLHGSEFEKEHIIPRSVFFDDSFSNKVCACRDCNRRKGQQTGYDFMLAEGDAKLQAYVDRANRLHEKYFKSKGKDGISKTKLQRLMMKASEIPDDFVERDLKLTQYIARKAVEILQGICRIVNVTNGAVTDFLRHAWGYDTILHDINLADYAKAGQTEIIEINHAGHIISEERILNWSKRLDHRHHAVDALVIALTRQGYIKRLNDLHKLINPQNKEAYAQKVENLDKWAASLPHVSYADAKEAIESSFVSFKAGKKVATKGKRYVFKKGKRILAQEGIVTPRGPLSEETVYGAILIQESHVPIKNLFETPHLIVNNRLKEAVMQRINDFDGNLKAAQQSLKKNPIILPGNPKPVEFESRYKKVAVRRIPLTSVTYKNLNKVVDPAIRQTIEARFDEVGNNDKAFVASLAQHPLYSDKEQKQQIKSVRCFVGDSPDSMMILRRNEENQPIAFAIFGNNHHCAIYTDPNGELSESIVSFADAVRRVRLGLPVVVTQPDKVWNLLNQLDEEQEQRFMETFPTPDRRFLFSMQVNDMFLLGLSDERILELLHDKDFQTLGKHLFRVQKLSHHDYNFKRHNSAIIDCDNTQIENGNYIRIRSFSRLKELNPVKVRIDRLGQLSII